MVELCRDKILQIRICGVICVCRYGIEVVNDGNMILRCLTSNLTNKNKIMNDKHEQTIFPSFGHNNYIHSAKLGTTNKS